MNDPDRCPNCWPLGCDCSDAQRPEAVPAEYTPLKNRGCHCGADFDGRDCMCFEFDEPPMTEKESLLCQHQDAIAAARHTNPYHEYDQKLMDSIPGLRDQLSPVVAKKRWQVTQCLDEAAEIRRQIAAL